VCVLNALLDGRINLRPQRSKLLKVGQSPREAVTKPSGGDGNEEWNQVPEGSVDRIVRSREYNLKNNSHNDAKNVDHDRRKHPEYQSTFRHRVTLLTGSSAAVFSCRLKEQG